MQSCGSISIAGGCRADCLYVHCQCFSSPGCLSIEDWQGNKAKNRKKRWHECICKTQSIRAEKQENVVSALCMVDLARRA